MQGVTDACFRDVVLEHHRPEDLGGAFTEFVRVVDHALPRRVLVRHLGPARHAMPVGLQLMGNDREAMARTAERAVAAGAPLIDLNFGCPAKGALRTCAGSAILRDPSQLEAIVRACADAVAAAVPVTAKIRAGYDTAEQVEDLARAAENGGAELLTIHCRTRKEGYQKKVDWTRIARAVAAAAIPVCGNGGVETYADLLRMRAETGCAFVMVGQGALADPWIFSGAAVSRERAVHFLLDYAARLASDGVTPRGAVGRIKQLLRYWTAGDLFTDEHERNALLAVADAEAFFSALERVASEPGSLLDRES